jgi:sulfhydrogenase subunit beta (sulfur reductase)
MNGLKIMPKGALTTWIEHLQNHQFRVIGPQKRHEQYVFDEIVDIKELEIDYPLSVMAPKKYLLPPREVLFSFNTNTMEMNAHIEVEPTVIIGLHTCDMHAIQLLDTVHATGFADQHYQARREALYLVSIECLSPCTEQCFCKDMETYSITENYDLHFVDLGRVYAVHVGSEKGEELLEGFASVWWPSQADRDLLNQVMSEKWPRFEFRLECELYELPEVVGAGQISPLWDELGDICLACGACTQVCPTCYCFDVTDEVDLRLENGRRVRTWDSCQIEKFALVAGGHNFRTSLALRQRHRFMRKGKYQYEAYGLMGCVGCGRCAAACHVDISCIKTFNALTREYRSKQAADAAEQEEYA